MNRNHALVVFHEPRAGGAVVSVLRTIPLLEERGWRFSFWVPRPSELHDRLTAEGHDVDGAPRYIDHSLRALRLPPGPARRLMGIPPYLRAFRRFLRERRPALVHANSILTLTEGVVASRIGIPVVLHVHEMVPRDRRGHLSRRLAWTRLQQVVAVSEACAKTVEWRGRHPRVVYEAAPVPERPTPIRDEPRPFTIGTVGVVSERKGTDIFVEAAGLARDRADGLRFELVAGSIAEREVEWAKRILKRASEAGVEYIERADVAERLAGWDGFALPSRADPFPISMLEAMAAGLPAIGTRVDGIAEQLADGGGLLVPGDDPEALADAMVRLARMPREARVALGAAGRSRVASRFTIDRQAEGIRLAYQAALHRDGG